MGGLPKHVESIESLRGIAALMVLLYHQAELVKIPLPSSLAFISTHFWLGVPLFYTISGFALAYGYADRLGRPAQIKCFYIRRLFRIAPLFYTMLGLWLLANWVAWNKTFSIQAIALNMSFLFGLAPGQHESIVWAGWSIGIEMLFYLIFPLLVMVVPNFRVSLGVFVVICLVSTEIFSALSEAGLGSYAYMNLGTHLPFFVGGVASFRLWQSTRFAQMTGLGWGLLVVSGLLALMVATSDYLYSSLAGFGFERNIWAIIFAVFLLSACFARNPALVRGPLRNLGKLSFSLYLLHPLIMAALIKLNFRMRITQMTDVVMANFLVATIFTIGLVWIISFWSFRFVEAPGIELGKRLTQRL